MPETDLLYPETTVTFSVNQTGLSFDVLTEPHCEVMAREIKETIASSPQMHQAVLQQIFRHGEIQVVNKYTDVRDDQDQLIDQLVNTIISPAEGMPAGVVHQLFYVGVYAVQAMDNARNWIASFNPTEPLKRYEKDRLKHGSPFRIEFELLESKTTPRENGTEVVETKLYLETKGDTATLHISTCPSHVPLHKWATEALQKALLAIIREYEASLAGRSTR